MSEEFDKNILFDNIYYLIKEQDKKIGEVENAIGVSSGYISRTYKDGGKPGIDFIINISKALKVSIDALLKIKLNSLTPTERYILSFLEKMVQDTNADRLNWKTEKADYLNHLAVDMNGISEHDLFSPGFIVETNGDAYPDYHTSPIFFSKSFGEDTIINGDCYNIRLKNHTYLYIMNISLDGDANTPFAFAKEVWIKSRSERQCLCTTGDKAGLSDIIDVLYSTVKESLKHPKINKDIKYSMDAFMNDDIEDDDNDGLPFNF